MAFCMATGLAGVTTATTLLSAPIDALTPTARWCPRGTSTRRQQLLLQPSRLTPGRTPQQFDSYMLVLP
jgi:hypothetical protein